MLLRKNEKPWVINEQKDDGYTPLHLASLNNHLDVVQLLVKLGNANKDYQNTSLQTPLHLAIQKQHAAIVRVSRPRLLLVSFLFLFRINKKNLYDATNYF